MKCLGLGGLLFPERILRMRSVSCLPFCPGAPPWVSKTLWGDAWIPGAGKGNSIQVAGSASSSAPPWDTVRCCCCCCWDTVHYSITNFQDKAGMGSGHLTLDGWTSKGDSKQWKRAGIFNIYLLRIWKLNYTIVLAGKPTKNILWNHKKWSTRRWKTKGKENKKQMDR